MWLIWRQHRLEILGLLLGAGLIAAALVYGADLATRVREEFGVDTCQPLPNTNANCVPLAIQAGERLQPFRWLVMVLLFLPALVGSFVGGPLFARDLERGTHRLVWTQGITRMRWAGTKLMTILIVAALAGTTVGVFGGLATTIVGSGDAYQSFDLQAPAVVSHVVFAVAVAAFVGTLSRRILTGMLAGLLLFGIVRVGVLSELRPDYEPPVAIVYGSDARDRDFRVPEGAWFIAADHVDREGRVVPPERVRSLIEASFRSRAPMNAYLAENGAYQRLRFQPAARFWRFQWIEAFLFVALSAALSLATLLLLKRRDA
jgi:hypothetical protein